MWKDRCYQAWLARRGECWSCCSTVRSTTNSDCKQWLPLKGIDSNLIVYWGFLPTKAPEFGCTWCRLLSLVICNVHMEDVQNTTWRWLLPVSLVHGWYLWTLALLNTGKNLIAGYKEQKTNLKLQTQLLKSSLQAEEIKEGMGQWIFLFFFFPLSTFQDLSV